MYFALVTEVNVGFYAAEQHSQGVMFHRASAEYIAFAGAVVLADGVVLLCIDGGRRWAPLDLGRDTLALGVAVSTLLPWGRVAVFHVTVAGVGLGTAYVAGALAIATLGLTRSRDRFPLAAATAVVAFGAFHDTVLDGPRLYGAWLSLGCALGLLLLELRKPKSFADLRWLAWRVLAVSAAAVLYAGSLFLPWQQFCESKQCGSSDAWYQTALLAALLLALVSVYPRRLGLSGTELAAGFAFLVATAAVHTANINSSADGVQFGFGAFVVLACASALVVSLIDRPPALEQRVIVPALFCIAYVVYLALPWWGILQLRDEFAFARFSWLTIAGVLLAIRLLWLWAGEGGRGVFSVSCLLLVPATLDAIGTRDRGFTWGDAVVAAVLLALVYLGWYDEREGLGNWRIPELLRVDRL